MISAKLHNELKKYGFELDFPTYDSSGEIIREIIIENNPRLNCAIPLIIERGFEYTIVIKTLNTTQKNTLNKIICIADKIFKAEKIENNKVKEILKKYKISAKIAKEEFQYFYTAFKDSKKSMQKQEEEYTHEQIQLRTILNRNIALSHIFSPGKQKIMEKIYSHELLTNTELKYYYKSIRPLILSICNDNLQKYVRIIESAKKYAEKKS